MEFNFEKLREAVDANLKYGDTYQKLSGITGLSIATWSRIIKGEGDLSINTVLKVCEWMNKPIGDFVTKGQVESPKPAKSEHIEYPGPGAFEIFQGKSGQFYFRLKARNGEVVLQSEGYASKSGAILGIGAVIRNASNIERFERKTYKDEYPYFILRASNGHYLGRSEMYKHPASRDNGIKTVRACAKPDTVIKDLT